MKCGGKISRNSSFPRSVTLRAPRTHAREPERNASLGARYLADLLDLWQGNPWLTVASYNAGPGAAGSWVSPELDQEPELWVERIPYPETRLYTKKVLGNLWAYLNNNGSSRDRGTEACTE